MAKNILVYKTATCPFCHKAMDFLKKHKIKFTSIDVGENPEAGAEMEKKSGQRGVPVIDIDGEIIVGFDEAALKKALKIAS
jgi:glutaredoxin 3